MNIRTFVAILSRNPQYDFPKMRGEGQRPFGTFPKIHPFGWRHLSLMKQSLSDREKWRKIKEEKLGLYFQINVLNYKC